MNSISKSKLRITGIDLVHFEIHSQIEKFDIKRSDCRWQYDCEFYRDSYNERKLEEKVDEIRVEVVLDYVSNDEEILVSAHADTYFTTKPLSRAEVNEELWFYLCETSLRHCVAWIAYRSEGTPMQGKIMPAISPDSFTNMKENLDAIWK